MQSRAIRRLAAEMRCTHRKQNSWRMTAEIHHIKTPEGELNPSLARRIAIQHYSPSRECTWRLIHDGALPLPKPRRIILDQKLRRAIIRALETRKPLPPPTPQTIRQFNAWLETREAVR